MISELTEVGNAIINQARKAIGKGKAITALFFFMPFAITSTAFSVSIKKGILNLFLSVIPDLTNPGQTILTLIFKGLNKSLNASP
ncbi:MAG: hypothetical protein BWY78_01292 [Alphaproteobacteria bacterium ADurb.Bin438]|nr:MAG: hypothetical protein BWY78_01292 [Alphaproteobacteria bacterium ADurb.Bin438]